jgi:hypothetical protein
MSDRSNLKRLFLYLLIGSVIIGAILGIVIVLRGEWGWFESRVVLTTVVIASASLCGLAADLSRTPRGLNLLPKTGLLLTLVASGLILVGIWSEITEAAFWKTVFCLSTFAIATVHVCLLSIAHLAHRFRWVFYIAVQVIYGLAALLSVLVIWEIGEPGVYRLAAAVAIVDAALSLVIPLLHRISRSERKSGDLGTPIEQRNLAAIDDEITRLRERIAELEKLRSQL